jgi:hypothetical protein
MWHHARGCTRQFPPSLAFIDLRYKLGGFCAETLTPMFQELGRMARYTVGEALHKLPIAFLHKQTFERLQKHLTTSTTLAAMGIKVGCHEDAAVASKRSKASQSVAFVTYTRASVSQECT